jgi:quercetin dioxygenase-like cupin family protein
MDEYYGTLSETINGLKKDDYTIDFNIQGGCLVGKNANLILLPEEFRIDKTYRFEGETNPEDQSILYAISSDRFNLKGILVNGYGISSEAVTQKLIEKLNTHPIINRTMENKSSKATSLRPEGERILNAKFVEIDLNKFIAELKQENKWADRDHNSITVFKSNSSTMVLMGMRKNAELKEHTAFGNISVQVLEGVINFFAEQQKLSLTKGQIITLEANIPHSVTAIEESFFLLTLVK